MRCWTVYSDFELSQSTIRAAATSSVCRAPTHPDMQGKTITGPGFTGYILNMTSQQWLTSKDVSRSIWWHYLVVVVPDEIIHKTLSGLYITGGSNNNGYPDMKDDSLQFAAASALANKVRGSGGLQRGRLISAADCVCGLVPGAEPAHRLCRGPVPPGAV